MGRVGEGGVGGVVGVSGCVARSFWWDFCKSMVKSHLWRDLNKNAS